MVFLILGGSLVLCCSEEDPNPQSWMLHFCTVLGPNPGACGHSFHSLRRRDVLVLPPFAYHALCCLWALFKLDLASGGISQYLTK